MRDKNLGILSATMRPSAAMRSGLRMLYGQKVDVALDAVLDNEVAVDALATLIEEGMAKYSTTDGRVDMRATAAHVIAQMRKSQLK